MTQVPMLGRAYPAGYLPSRRLDLGFDALLEKEINISKTIRTAASASQNHLRDFLCSEGSRDSSFPSILSKADADFLGGSFARHTKNWPLDDIDVYLPLDGWNLIYVGVGGNKLPHVVRSDGSRPFNPLLLPRWTDGNYISPLKIVSEFAKVLRRHYPAETDVQAAGKCITVRLTHGETTDRDGLGYDIVPCFSMKPDDTGELDFYLMPDGAGGWMKTNPRMDTYISGLLQDLSDKAYRKVVKLVKYWSRTQLGDVFSSYYIEFAVCGAFLARNAENQIPKSVSGGLAAGFGGLLTAWESGDQKSWIPGAPPILRTYLTETQRNKLAVAKHSATLAADFEAALRFPEALSQWSAVFGQTL
jgi:hypothetical protein